LNNCSFYAAAPYLEGKAGTSISAFVRLIDHMRDATRHYTLPETVDYVIQNSGLIQHYLAEREGQDRVENLQELVNAATAFIAEEGFAQDTVAGTSQDEPVVEMSPLAGFLAHASLEAGDNQAQAGQDAVQLMTVHAAKGLEFTNVFITGLEEGLFPHENSINEDDGLEEERRLMYVAITRAKERLFLSHTQSRLLHGQVRYNLPSRFLDELPAESLKHLTPKNKDARWGGATTTRMPSWSEGSDWGGPAATVPRSSNSAITAPISSMPRKDNGHGFRVGQSVFHTKFGEGRILALEGQAEQAKAHVNFNRHGAKWLQLAIAKLTAID
jgi:DNA helicase-2/ATP-dependent DNA helicase PcrA